MLLPSTEHWCAWWEQQQCSAQNISEVAFSDEYLLLVADPLAANADANIKKDLDTFKRRLRISELVVPPEIPKHFCWYEHDAYMEADFVLPTPRGLPCIRCTACEYEVEWGDETGEPKNVSRSNVIKETDCCLVVKVPVPMEMTLSHVVGTRDWQAARIGSLRRRVVFLPPSPRR
eukprot:s9_g5.t1